LRLSEIGAEGVLAAGLDVGLAEGFDGGTVPRLPKEKPDLLAGASVSSVGVGDLCDGFRSRTASDEDEALCEVVAFAGCV
jgi:hypothetical protein